MAHYIVYWPQDRVQELKKAGDKGPIKVVFGSIHSRMPSIVSVKVGDAVFPVALIKKKLYVMARLPVTHRERAFDYCMRELGCGYGALIPEGIVVKGSDTFYIEPRLMPDEAIPLLRFGYPKSKEKPLRLDKDGNVLSMSLASTRRMSKETAGIFEELF